MRLAGFLDPDLVKVPLAATTKKDAIEELVGLVVRKFPSLDRAAIARAIAEREEIENTSVGRGFAFPHARLEGVDRMYIAMGVSRHGIPDRTPDAEPIRILVLILTPRNMTRFYLQTLSALMMVCRNAPLREKLFGAENAESILREIWESGVIVQNELLARDIMRRPVIAVRPQTTLREVANLLYRHRISGMPVVDEGGRVVGEISERELIAAAMPDFARPGDQPAAPAAEEPFEALLRREDTLTAGELMTPPEAVVGEDETVIELAALMLRRNIRRVFVATDGELVGLIMRSDIVSRVIRG